MFFLEQVTDGELCATGVTHCFSVTGSKVADSHFAPILCQQWWQIIANPYRSPFFTECVCRVDYNSRLGGQWPRCIEWLREPGHFPPEWAQNKQRAALKVHLCRCVEQYFDELDAICNWSQNFTQLSCIGPSLEDPYMSGLGMFTGNPAWSGIKSETPSDAKKLSFITLSQHSGLRD